MVRAQPADANKSALRGLLVIGFMIASHLHYFNGAEVHAGDRVRYHDQAGNVVVVSDGDGAEYVSGYSDYQGCEAGIMFCSDDGELTFLSDGNEGLELVRRKDEPTAFGA
jgi:hypothetical protein